MKKLIFTTEKVDETTEDGESTMKSGPFKHQMAGKM
jgi:hypothetical protein